MKAALVFLTLTGSACAPERALKCSQRPSASEVTPVNLSAFELISVDVSRSRVATGHVLLNQFDKKTESWAAAIDGCGAHVWWQRRQDAGSKITRTRMGKDGHSVIYAEYDREREVDRAEIRRIDLDTGEVTITRATEQHHDFVELGDGRLAWLSWEYSANLWLENLNADIASDAILIADEGTEGDHEVLFSYLSDSGIEPFWSCNHMRRGIFVPGYAEWSHTNSLVYDVDEDAYFALARYWDAVLRIEGDGTLSWILGGPLDQFQSLGQATLPRHGHMSEAWPGGMLVFDNRNHGDDEASRVVEYAFDEARGVVEEVWSFQEPHGSFLAYLGDARRLPGGNVLIAWSGTGRITEVTRDGDIVWEAKTDQEIGRLEFVEDWPWLR